MSKFDYMNFNIDGWDMEFVAHAKKFSKSETIDLCIGENDWRFDEKYCNGKILRIPTIEDIKERTVRYYPRVPEGCGLDVEGGCYTYCKREERGSFPVWVIVFEELEED